MCSDHWSSSVVVLLSIIVLGLASVTPALEILSGARVLEWVYI